MTSPRTILSNRAALLVAVLCSAVMAPLAAHEHADQSAPAPLEVADAWARATSPVATMGAVYGVVKNSSAAPLTIASMTTTAAAMAQIHETREVDGMMRMRHIDPVTIPPGGQLELVPGGKHMMLMNLSAPLVEGDEFNVVLTLANGKSVTIPVSVGAMDQLAAP